MINENEIRIGNYFEHDENWCYRNSHLSSPPKFIFSWEERDWNALGECTMSLEDCFPVILTHEILKKCGFKMISNDMSLGLPIKELLKCDYKNIYLGFNNLGLSICFYYDTSDIPSPSVDDSTVLEHIKYLHQLQNLYHDLIGKELEINLQNAESY